MEAERQERRTEEGRRGIFAGVLPQRRYRTSSAVSASTAIIPASATWPRVAATAIVPSARRWPPRSSRRTAPRWRRTPPWSRVLAVVVNTTRAVVAGPRATLLAVKPCCGLHDSRKAPAAAHWATTVPPDELRTVPLVLAVPADPPVRARAGAARPVCPPGAAPGSRRAEEEGSAALAGLCLHRGRRAGLLAGGRGGDALAKLRYHQQAARGRRGRPEQPRACADDNAGTHAARVADATLSASKDRLKETRARRPANTGSSARNGERG